MPGLHPSLSCGNAYLLGQAAAKTVTARLGQCSDGDSEAAGSGEALTLPGEEAGMGKGC